MQLYRSVLGFATCLVLVTGVYISAQPRYTFTDLGALQPVAVIDGPIVFGNLNGEPAVWEDGQTRPLLTYGQGGQVNGVNARGDSVGWVIYPGSSGPVKLAAFWLLDGFVFILPSTGEAEARGVNLGRVVAGTSLTSNAGIRWYPGRVEEYLMEGPLATGNISGRAIDGQNRVWGHIGNVVTVWEADTTEGYSMISDDPSMSAVQAVVTGANETVAVGTVDVITLSDSAAHYTFPFPPSVVKLAKPDGARVCRGNGINNQPSTVGGCQAPPMNSPFRATLWQDSDTAIYLDTLINTPTPLEQAWGVSEDGHIVGISAGKGWLLSPARKKMGRKVE